MAIHAIDLHCRARLPINFPVAVIILREMAIRALHAFLQMNVGQVHGLLKLLRIVERDRLPVLVQPVPFSIVVINPAKHPAMPVKIRKLRRLQFGIELRAACLLQKFVLAPQPARRRHFRILQRCLVSLFLAGIPLLWRIHFAAVNFVIPPRQPEICRHHVRARMDMADHALAGRNRPCEGVLDRMPWLIFANRRIRGSAETAVPILRIRSRVSRVAVIRINHMARRTSARPVVARMIIRPGQGKHGIKQPRLLQSQKNRIGAKFRAKSAVAQFVVGLSRTLFPARVPDLRLLLAAAFENPQHVSRL